MERAGADMVVGGGGSEVFKEKKWSRNIGRLKKDFHSSESRFMTGFFKATGLPICQFVLLNSSSYKTKPS